MEIASDSSVSVRVSGLVLLLSLLPNAVADVALAHGLVLHLHELCSKIPGVLQGGRQAVSSVLLHSKETNPLEETA